MKKKTIIISIIVLCSIIGFFYGRNYIKTQEEKARVEKIKKGWYIEVTTEFINVRIDANMYSTKIGTIYDNSVYEAIDVYYTGGTLWYKIQYNKNTVGWICGGKSNEYAISYNKKFDLMVPQVYFYEDIYYVDKIENINYNHLKVVDDNSKDCVVTSVVYHEYDNTVSPIVDQYWIVYTVTDATNKSSQKTQKIEFNEIPDESKVTNWEEYVN